MPPSQIGNYSPGVDLRYIVISRGIARDLKNLLKSELTAMNTITTPSNGARPMAEEADFLQLKAIDHVHWWVGNAKQTMYYWWKAFGFKPVAYSGLETGNRSFASYVLSRLGSSRPHSASKSPFNTCRKPLRVRTTGCGSRSLRLARTP